MALVQGGHPGDLDGSGAVDAFDLATILNHWGQTVPPADQRADPTGDGLVNSFDLGQILNPVVIPPWPSTTIDLAAIGSTTAGVVFEGVQETDRAGFALAGVGDVNGDGIGDLLIGARGADPEGKTDAGQTYLIYAPAAGMS